MVSTLTLISVGRRRELRLLRLIGAGRGQLTRMLLLETALVAFAGLVVGTLVAAIPSPRSRWGRQARHRTWRPCSTGRWHWP
ncbi:FtsX-like permease family protein [Streptomyces sp. M10(2022)]